MCAEQLSVDFHNTNAFNNIETDGKYNTDGYAFDVQNYNVITYGQIKWFLESPAV